MKNQILALAAATLAISAAASIPAYAAKQTAAEKGEAKLAKLLEGRVAGKPVNCISAYNSSDMQVIDQTAIVYKQGGTLYVARPTDPKSLRKNDILVTRRTGSQICVNDSMRMVDQNGGFLTSVVFLDKFVPYEKEG
ncbi:MAG TPA: hypothetical protein VL100_12900 [Croceibacterium sp.]|nr:hypothetical protein [Croceibacterium sp.]